ncbi:abscission/NoCut checkpoint regulator-like isoform X1 [Dendronephthya gigantea]|uniref:abscission/NoCut checkpoint regulator-like isoform X1 n=1 Tax=Dendronephthya gigantea TaxID=151771 RepID=UPI001069FF45|nr:abscission/NoCut checkpoint regulator-like isoform X1 [Dendronephthya gigantea]
MAGRCFQCAEQFGFFKREYDCGNCGKIFCSKCTSNSIVIPSKGKKAVKVCNDCHKKLISQTSQKGQQTQHGITQIPSSKQTTQNLESSTKPLDVDGSTFDPDEDIQRRLKKLKERDDAISEADVADVHSKFENLTGRAPSSAKTNDVHTFGPKKTDAEEMSDLLKQMQDECNIDDRAGYKPSDGNSGINTEDIEGRLDKLKGREPRPKPSGPPTNAYDSDDEAEFRKRYIQQENYLIELNIKLLQRNMKCLQIQMSYLGVVFAMKMPACVAMDVMMICTANVVSGKDMVEESMKIIQHHPINQSGNRNNRKIGMLFTASYHIFSTYLTNG